jgi:hypothetical protein
MRSLWTGEKKMTEKKKKKNARGQVPAPLPLSSWHPLKSPADLLLQLADRLDPLLLRRLTSRSVRPMT